VHASELERPVEAKPALQVQLAGEAGAVPADDVALPGHGAHRDEAELKKKLAAHDVHELEAWTDHKPAGHAAQEVAPLTFASVPALQGKHATEFT